MTSALSFSFSFFFPSAEAGHNFYLFLSFTFAIQDSCYIILKTQLRMNMLEVVVMLNNPPSFFIYLFFKNPKLKETLLCCYGLEQRKI